MKIHVWKLAGAIILCEAAGLIGSIFTASSVSTWYATLLRPELAPPNWLFGPVWTTLYALMGVALYLVWTNTSTTLGARRIAIKVFFVQLVLNVFWSFIFFGTQEIGWALVEIIALWLSILASIITFVRVSRPAAWLLIPYLLWVSFATYLNYMLWVFN